ncbi:MAG: diphthine--ammonia ligase [Chitinophagaceae bacterium]|nr:diphthine--ammonia ligase [Chitinophagaceae bacterium]
MNWSGGKDSSLTLHRVLEDPAYKVDSLLTSVNAAYHRVSMHGVRRRLLEAQAASIGLPLQTIELPEQPGMDEYEEAMREKVCSLKERGCTHAIFGDIFLEDLRRYREEKLESMGVTCIFPLWKNPSRALMQEFLEKGFKAIIVCVNTRWLDKSFCGRIIDEAFLEDLPADVDPCGENGEYHSFVFEGPIFKYPIPFEKGEIVSKEYKGPEGPVKFYFCDLNY